MRGEPRLDASALPDQLRAVHARVQGRGQGVPRLGRRGRVQHQPRVHDPHVPRDVRGLQGDVQGRPGRLHDRIAFMMNADGEWFLERLAP